MLDKSSATNRVAQFNNRATSYRRRLLLRNQGESEEDKSKIEFFSND
mgnify:CR=1 FL=1